MEDRYNHLNSYLKNRFGERVLKICVDAGFTCPNRDGTKGLGGCLFCGEGAGENIKGKCEDVIISIKNQINTFLNSYRGKRANKFIVYFQSFSNTYDSIENLKLKYDTALNCSEKIIGLQIATRPDLITDKIIELLLNYQKNYYVCVELGLQTASNRIGDLLNRKYSLLDFENSAQKLKDRGIDVVGHIMVGLPNENEEDILETVKVINKNCVGVKIHNTYVQSNTGLAKMYLDNLYKPITIDNYVDKVVKIISHLNKNIIIHRINADPPKDRLIAPEWSLRKKIILNSINSRLNELDIVQGDRKYS